MTGRADRADPGEPEATGVAEAILVDRMLAARAAIDDRIRRAGGAPDAVTVVAVSKTYPAAAVRAAALAGFGDVGESFAAELAAKAPQVHEPVRWHFVGQLQTNKVRVVAPHVDVYQSVDRPSLVAELAKRAPAATVLVQVNLAGDERRGGASWSDAPRIIDAARSAGLDVVGLMGVAPLADERTVAAAFGRLRSLCDDEGLAECSMGMSADLELAVAEGATMVRVGAAIFGDRT